MTESRQRIHQSPDGRMIDVLRNRSFLLLWLDDPVPARVLEQLDA
jgi:hypothetical protein